MDSLAALYHITPENLALRREFIGLDGEVVALLADLQPWADEVADAVAADLTEHHFQFSATADFFGSYAAERRLDLDSFRASGTPIVPPTGEGSSPNRGSPGRSESSTSRSCSKPDRRTTGSTCR